MRIDPSRDCSAGIENGNFFTNSSCMAYFSQTRTDTVPVISV
jgi:hypothetical protein